MAISLNGLRQVPVFDSTTKSTRPRPTSGEKWLTSGCAKCQADSFCASEFTKGKLIHSLRPNQWCSMKISQTNRIANWQFIIGAIPAHLIFKAAEQPNRPTRDYLNLCDIRRLPVLHALKKSAHKHAKHSVEAQVFYWPYLLHLTLLPFLALLSSPAVTDNTDIPLSYMCGHACSVHLWRHRWSYMLPKQAAT